MYHIYIDGCCYCPCHVTSDSKPVLDWITTQVTEEKPAEQSEQHVYSYKKHNMGLLVYCQQNNEEENIYNSTFSCRIE